MAPKSNDTSGSDPDPDSAAAGARESPVEASAAGAPRNVPTAPTARQLAEAAAEQRRQRRIAKREQRRQALSTRADAWRSRYRDRRQRRREIGEAKPQLKKLRVAIVFSGIGLLAVVSWVFGIMMAVAQDLPDLEARAQYDRAQNSLVLASDGTELTTLTGNEKRFLLESGEISPLIKQAVVAIEDERFYNHRGIDYLGIARALQQDIIAGSAVQGGSTITQQFVKNALEAQGSRTVLQKLREAALAYQIERQWSKDRILTNYLNNVYFGEGAYGVEAAARTYFADEHPGCGEGGEPCAKSLASEEAAMLAAMISSPSAYSPRANPEAAQAQRNIVLNKMREQGSLEVTDEQLADLESLDPPSPSEIQPPTNDTEAPYFTDWLRQQVVERYGAGRAFGGGLEIKTTLDIDLQRAAEDAVSSRLSGLGPTSAVVVLDNDTAGVLAMVGGSDFEQAPFNLATNGRRQPGSAFKPFTLVTALKEGRSPDEVYESRPIEIPFEVKITKKNGEKEEVTDLFDVSNYDDSYLGSASIATATTNSDNSVYAQLGTDVGINDVVDTAHELGIESRIDDNPAIILGGLERGVTPLEMAYSYNTLANQGARISGTAASGGNGKGAVAIAKVTDSEGELVPDSEGSTGENELISEQVLDPGVAEQATSILSTVVTSGTGTNAQVGDDYIWGKTGTTDNNADAWFVGANEEVTVAVWVGYADGGTPMLTEYGGAPVDGGTIPALLWSDIVSAYDELTAGDEEADESPSSEPIEEIPVEEVAPEVAPASTEDVAPLEPAPVPEEPSVPEAPAPPPEQTPATPEEAPPEGGGGTSAGVPAG